MIVDSSAILAILFKEEIGERILDRIIQADTVGVGAPTLVESGIVFTARTNLPESLIADFTTNAEIRIIPFSEEHWREAIFAYARFGKGRHQASLNFGDCLSYALARVLGRPLLCTGSDFNKTDIPLVDY
jgi:ribonuclease VapC